MARRFLRFAVLVAILAGSSALAASRPALAQTPPPPPPARVPGHVLPALQHASKAGKNSQAGGKDLSLTVVLNRTDKAGFDAFVDSHEHASQADLSNRFGPSQQAYDAVLAYLQQSGFTLVHGSANRLTLTVKGTRGQAEQAFGVSLDDYQLNGQSFYANDSEPALPATIAPYVQAITGLANLAVPKPHAKTQPATTTSGTALAPTPMAIATAYDFGGTGTNGAGQKLGLAEFDSYSPSDVSNWLTWAGLPSSLINQLSEVNINGGTSPSGGNGTIEALLDIDAVMGAAQGATYVVYDAPNCYPTCTSFQTMFNAMIADGDTVISNSWGYCENQTTLADVMSIDAILASAAASGISVYSASGDLGARCDSYDIAAGVPADAPHGTGVGGTSLTTASSAAYQGEIFWNTAGGTGGDGVSTFFSEPSYQTGFISASGRSVPDVSADADPNSGIAICMGACPAYLVGGTSLAAPIWAAGTALINQKLGHLTGNLNEALYAHGTSNGFHPASSMSSSFRQVGLGSFDLGNLTVALGGGGGGTNAAPTVTAVSPATAPATGGTAVTVNGSGFVAGTSGTSIIFGVNTAAQVSCGSTTSCTVTSPAGSLGTVDVKAQTAAGTSATSSADQFTYSAASAPTTVTSISPTSGPAAGGTSVNINGTGFSTAGGGTAVKFGSMAGTNVRCGSATQCTVTSPAGSGTADVTVTVGTSTSATSAADKFSYAPPTVTGISPTSGPSAGGTNVTINGSGFSTASGVTAVSFGGVPAVTVKCNNTNQCTATSPAGSGSVSITLMVGGAVAVVGAAGGVPASGGDQFSYMPPAVASISPTSGLAGGGTNVTIKGSGFSTAAGATSILFGGAAAANVKCGSTTQCTATSPAGSGVVDVTVTVAGLTSTTSAADQFTYIVPAVTSISPASGPSAGGTKVTINGNGFSQATGVTGISFGGVAATNVKCGHANQCTATSPAGSGVVDVTVTVGGATSVTSAADHFSYGP